jgi:Flp pilus assembly protein TadD
MSEGRSAPVGALFNKAGKQRPLLMAVAFLCLLLLLLYGPAALESFQANLISIQTVRLAVTSPPVEADNRCHALHVHGRAAYLQGQYEEARAELERAVACNDYQWAWFDLGRAQYALGRLDEATVSWREAGAAGYAEVMAQQAAANGDSEAAFAAWKMAAMIDPSSARPFVEMGKYLRAAGCFTEARTVYEHLATLDVSNDTAEQTESALNQLAEAQTDPALTCPAWP